MTTHLPAACDATSYMQGSTVSEDNVVRCPVSHVSIQSTGLQTPRTLSCCGAICCHWALEMVRLYRSLRTVHVSAARHPSPQKDSEHAVNSAPWQRRQQSAMVLVSSRGLRVSKTRVQCTHYSFQIQISNYCVQVLCSKQVPCCPICGSILPFHNSCDYPLDYDTINKLKAFSSPAIPRDGSEFNSARERLRNDRTVRTSTEPCTTPHSCNLLPTHLLVQAPVDLFVAAEFFNTTEEKKALTPALTPAQLTREQNRKAGEVRERVAATRAPDVLGQGSAGQSTAWDASQGRDLSVHVLHAHPGPQQHKLKPTERLLCIPPRGFILKISRGMLIGRLREMIASKMGVSCKAVQLKLLSQHTLCTPQSKTSSIPSAYCAHEKAVEKSGAVCGGQAPFSSVQKAHTMSNTSALTKAESHGASSAPHAGILPGADSNCKKNERTLEGQGARSMLDPAAPMWKCKPAESSQAGRRPIHLQEWQPSCPSVPCQATGQGQPANGETPPRPGKHTLGAIAGNPIREIRSSMDLSSNKNSLGRREDLQSSRVGQHLSTVDDNSESGLVDAVSATSATETFGSAGTGVESHRLSRLSSCTCTSSNDSWETTRGSGTASGSGTEAGNVPDQPKHMESLKRLRVGKSVHCMPTYKDALTNLKGKMDISSHASTAEHDVSTPLSTAALSLLSEATATSEQLSVGCEHAVDTEQVSAPLSAAVCCQEPVMFQAVATLVLLSIPTFDRASLCSTLKVKESLLKLRLLAHTEIRK